MECACIEGNDGGDCVDLHYSIKTIAFVPVECNECNRQILNEDYTLEKFEWEEEISFFRTCDDCMSVRDHLFCGFIYSMLWEDLENHMMEYWHNDISYINIAKLTKKAREKVCEIIEKTWEKMEDGEE